MSITYTNKSIDLESLTTSAANVRAMGKSRAVASLAADIASQGLIQPLTVFKDGKLYRVDAGQRRFAALKLLAGRGEWSGPVPCRIIPADASTDQREAVSFSENAGQLPMHPLDRMRVLARFAARGSDVAQIAARFGLEETEVAKILRLERLALPLRKLLAENRITEGAALAYASTTDRAAMMTVFNRFGPGADASLIRRTLQAATGETRTTMTESHRLFRFVQAEYEASGGQVGGDLFTPEGDRTVDAVLTRQLAAHKLAEAADALKAETGATWAEASIDALAYSNHPEWRGEADQCPVPLGVYLFVTRYGEIASEADLIRKTDYDAWEAEQRAIADAEADEAEPEDDDTDEDADAGQDDDSDDADTGTGATVTPLHDPEAEPRAPSRPMNKATEDALTAALQEAVGRDFGAALDLFLVGALTQMGAHSAPVQMSLGRGTLDSPDWLDTLVTEHRPGFRLDPWGVVDAMDVGQKAKAFAHFMGNAARANSDTMSIDRPQPFAHAITLGQRVGLNMHGAWQSEARRDYLTKMSKHDLAFAVLGLSGDDAGEAMKSDKAALVERAHEARWLPAYFTGLDVAPVEPVSEAEPEWANHAIAAE